MIVEIRFLASMRVSGENHHFRVVRSAKNTKIIQSGVLFPTHMGGKSGFEKLFPTHFAGPWGGNRGLFPPHSADPGGEIEVIFPHNYGGKSGPPQAEILRI